MAMDGSMMWCSARWQTTLKEKSREFIFLVENVLVRQRIVAVCLVIMICVKP